MTTTQEAELVLAVTKRLLETKGEHPESAEVKAELARMFLESQSIITDLNAQIDKMRPYVQVSP